MRWITGFLLGAGVAMTSGSVIGAEPAGPAEVAPLERVIVSEDGNAFALAGSGAPFRPWGFNYDHDERDGGRLIEDYWEDEWETVVEDFREMRSLGANVVRVHLQVGRFLCGPDEPNRAALGRLGKLVDLAAAVGLHLDLTGLGCYHRDDIPGWFVALDEPGRWSAQARFWEAIAETCRGRPAVFCYDLMNEPIVPGEPADDWLAGELGGKHFVQRLTLDPAGREREAIVRAWVEKMVGAIRRHDRDALVTVGVIPWAHVFPGAKPIFYAEPVAPLLDFVSVHFYPKSGGLDRATEALAVYDVGKPLVVEECFPLECSLDEMGDWMRANDGRVDGWISFYWGRTPEEYDGDEGIAPALKAAWLRRFREQRPQ